MKTRMTGLAGMIAMAGMALALAGCGNTANGVQQDASKDTQAVDTASRTAAAKAAAGVDKAGAAVKDVPKDVDSATVVTPEVKTAIVRDPILNDSRNVINVNSHDNVTHLKGHVVNASMKQRATDDAQKALSGRHSDYKVSNELTVAGG